MRVSTIIGLVLALGSTVLISLSYVREHDAAAGLPALSLRRPLHSAKLLLSSRPWLLGFAMESAGFGVYVAALALAPLALVQSVAAGGIGILAVASARLAHRRLTHRELAGASLSVLGLTLLAISLSGGDARDTSGALGTILWLAITTGAAMLVFASGRTFLRRGVADGIADGLFFAIGDIPRGRYRGRQPVAVRRPNDRRVSARYLAAAARLSERVGAHGCGAGGATYEHGSDRSRNGRAGRAGAQRRRGGRPRHRLRRCHRGRGRARPPRRVSVRRPSDQRRSETPPRMTNRAARVAPRERPPAGAQRAANERQR